MRRAILISYLVLCVFFAGRKCFGEIQETHDGAQYADPARYTGSIQRFETRDRENPPPEGAIVCTGSSSMRGWHETIKTDLAPLTVIPRGFGGSTMNDLLHYTDRIILPYKPRSVVLYEGDNDIAAGISPAKILKTFSLLVAKIHKALPECRIYVLSIKPSITRWHLWPEMQKANNLIAAECASQKLLTYVDVATGMMNKDGNLRKDIFQEDGLHMVREGYILWRDILKPVLIEEELRFERK